jgi:hypothetical protein
MERKNEVICIQVQEALGITDMEIAESECRRARVEKQIERALDMEIDTKGSKESTDTLQIKQGRTEPEISVTAGLAAMVLTATPPVVQKMIPLRMKENPMLIATLRVRHSKEAKNACMEQNPH